MQSLYRTLSKLFTDIPVSSIPISSMKGNSTDTKDKSSQGPARPVKKKVPPPVKGYRLCCHFMYKWRHYLSIISFSFLVCIFRMFCLCNGIWICMCFCCCSTIQLNLRMCPPRRGQRTRNTIQKKMMTQMIMKKCVYRYHPLLLNPLIGFPLTPGYRDMCPYLRFQVFLWPHHWNVSLLSECICDHW